MATDNDSERKRPRSTPAVDTDALRARLGLGAAQPEESVDTLVEEPMEEGDKTPVPQAMPQQPVVDMDEEVGTTGIRLQMGPLVVALSVVVLVSGALGSILGGATSERDQLEAYNKVVERKLKKFQDAKTKSDERKVDVLERTREALKTAVGTIDRVESEEADLLTLEPTFEELLPKLQAFQKDEAWFEPDKVMDDVIVLYEEDVLLESVEFAIQTRHLRDQVASLIGEAVATARIGAPTGAATRTILAEKYEREVEKLGKIPASRGVYVQDTGSPSLVKLTDRRGRTKGEQWQLMVLRQGHSEPVQVPTTDVVTLDVKPLYEAFSKTIRRHTVKRMAKLVRDAHKIASDIDWGDLETKLQNPPR